MEGDAFRSMRRMARRALEAVFPLECLACGSAGFHACPACVAGLRLASWRLESREASPLTEVRAAAAYAAPLVRKLVTDWKYEGLEAASDPLERLVRRWAAKHASSYEGSVIVPVPLHPSRGRERGFNQAERIGRWLSAAWGSALRTNLVFRTRRTRPQARLEEGRTANVRGAFSARLGSDLVGVPVLLVDDVWTTGATMRACAEALRRAGAGEVRGFVLAHGGRQDA